MSKLAAAMTGEAELKRFESPDEAREFPEGRLELIKVGGATIGRVIFEPGWRCVETRTTAAVRALAAVDDHAAI